MMLALPLRPGYVVVINKMAYAFESWQEARDYAAACGGSALPVVYEDSASPAPRVNPLIDGDGVVEHLLTDGTLCLVDGPHRRAACTFHGGLEI